MITSDELDFSRLDLAFARFLSQRTSFDTENKTTLTTLLATLSQKQHQGHSCLDVNDSEKNLLLASGLCSDNPTETAQHYPLIIEQNCLYLQRYWFYENRLAKKIKRLSQTSFRINAIDGLLDHYFINESSEINWQREAAKMVAQQAFCIITGGPGTGKTTTVCKILALLQEQATQPLMIALTAPTGKAAMRLQEAIAANLDNLNCPDNIKALLPKTANTLHRLLGAKPPSPYFHHTADNPLAFDLVVVDEASMVDLALMSKLVDALKSTARLILLGDKDQLASIESGAVLADLISVLPKNTVELTHSYRFNENIKHLADTVNQQDAEPAWQLLSSPNDTITLLDRDQLITYILKQRSEYINLVNSGAEFKDVLVSFNYFQVLCSNRYGSYGTVDINHIVERELSEKNLGHHTNPWYAGRPVMVLQNNPAIQLYNGDIGICLSDKDQNDNIMVFFERPDGSIRKYLPTRLPPCETVFAMTIHKSQGSEFDDILIVLPETSNPVLNKELLYTAITRAKKTIKLVTDKSIFIETLTRKNARMTGLVNKFQ